MEQSLAGLLTDLDLSDTGRRVQTSFVLTPSRRRTSISGRADLSIIQDVTWQSSATQDVDRWHDLQVVNLEEVNDAEDNGDWVCAIEGAGDEMYLVLSFDPLLNLVRVKVSYSGGIPEIAEIKDSPRLVEAFQMLLMHEATIPCLAECAKMPFATPAQTASMLAFYARKEAHHMTERDRWLERFNVFRFHTGETGPSERTPDASLMDEGFVEY